MEEIVLFLGYIGIILTILGTVIITVGSMIRNNSLVFIGSLVSIITSFTWIYRFNLAGDWQAALVNYFGLAVTSLYVILMIIAIITGIEKFNLLMRKE